MKKKIISILLCFTMLFAFSSVAFAADTAGNVLQFNEDGKFTIVHLTDSHLHYPMPSFQRAYITEMLETVKPDIVVLGGDTVTDFGDAVPDGRDSMEAEIEELCDILAAHKTYFTITLGNHDRQNGHSGELLFSYYARYGGEYFLGYNVDDKLDGYGTHDLPVLSSDGSKIAFDLYMFDSGAWVADENGNSLGYDSVHADAVEWYKNRAAELKAANGGNVVPAMAFQHIIVQEIDDYVFYPVPFSVGAIGEDFDGKHILFTPIPKIHNAKSGVIMEKPCPGYYNHGQFDAMKETGDIIAVYSGHDHSNTFTINIDGIDVVNTGGCKFQTDFRFFTSGVRVITVDEKDPSAYESHMYSMLEAAGLDGSEVLNYGDFSKASVNISKIASFLFQTITKIAYFFNFTRFINK